MISKEKTKEYKERLKAMSNEDLEKLFILNMVIPPIDVEYCDEYIKLVEKEISSRFSESKILKIIDKGIDRMNKLKKSYENILENKL